MQIRPAVRLYTRAGIIGITHTPCVALAESRSVSVSASVSVSYCQPSVELYTHAKNQLLKWKYSCVAGVEI